MIRHYFKIAFRNLQKYKTQSIISVIGLAVGITCFTLATLWIRYEMTYDTFHRKADNIYMVRAQLKSATGVLSNSLPYPAIEYLKKNLPEIEDICGISPMKRKLQFNDRSENLLTVEVDSAFINMFDVRLLKGNVNFLKERGKEIAITESLAKSWFGEEDPLGKEVELGGRLCRICAVVSDWSQHSNLAYSILLPIRHYPDWLSETEQIFIRIRSNTDIESFQKRVSAINLSKQEKESSLGQLTITPITSLRYSDYLNRDEIVISFNYIRYFAIAGALVILCSLFNYLTLFISRLRMRGREMGLRKVCGATDRSLFALFSIEYLLVLIAGSATGMVLIELCLSRFIELAQISETTSLYSEAMIYIIAVIILSFIISQIPLYYFRKRTLQNNIQNKKETAQRGIFRKSGLVMQLIISLGFIFCTAVMMKQLYYLKNTDLGMERHNLANVAIWMKGGDINEWNTKIASLPMVTETLPPHYFPIIPTGPMMYTEINGWDGQNKTNDETYSVGIMPSGEDFFKYYGLHLSEGEWLSDKSITNDVIINETAALKFEWKSAVGKKFYSEYDGQKTFYHVIGVVKDFSHLPPTVAPQPLAFVRAEEQQYLWGRASILFKFKEGSWKACLDTIQKMQNEDFPSSFMRLYNEEEEYNKYLRSEDALMTLLGIVSLVCVIISIFGIFSQVTLSCEQRRKEIAIRKVNGATIKNILQMFFKEYFILLFIAAIIAFPISHIIMQTWIESYIRQTTIPAWMYVAIFIGIAGVIVISIFSRVWSAARQNLAEVVKTE